MLDMMTFFKFLCTPNCGLRLDTQMGFWAKEGLAPFIPFSPTTKVQVQWLLLVLSSNALLLCQCL